MRDLTEEELKLAPEGCDHYNIIDGKVYFTDVLGIGVFDIGGNKVNNCIMDNKVFTKSRPLPKKPFDINEHEFGDSRLSFSGETFDVCIDICDCCEGTVSDVVNFDFNKDDAIAIAKALGVTSEDLRSWNGNRISISSTRTSLRCAICRSNYDVKI